MLMSVKIFFCYAREDEPLFNKLKTHLRPLQRQGLIDVWYDRDISAGTEWEREISQHLNASQVILLLVSPDFMNSDYCYGIEMKRAMERHTHGEVRVIPVILRPVYWQGVLGKLHVLPKDALPVTDPDWHNMDRAFFNVAEGIREVVERLSAKPFVKPTVPSGPLLDDPSDKVVVVAARDALPEYLKHSVYICQPNRAFQRCIRFAFYANGKIDRRVPKILGQVEAVSRDEIETRKDLTDLDRERLQNLLKNLERTRSDDWSQQLKIIFLSAPDSPDTLLLPDDVVNNLTTSDGRSIAFTQGQRYVLLSRLEKGPTTTSEL
jgi:hypothetical protein